MIFDDNFKLDSVNREEQIATRDIPVFKYLNRDLTSLSHYFQYQVGKANPTVDLEVVNNEIEKGYQSFRTPARGRYRFVIPKGSKYYYTINGSLQYVSDSLMLVSDKPLTEEECIEICNFPKTYVEACERLGIKPLDESSIQSGMEQKQNVAYKKLETVIECINRQYGIEKYDCENIYQHKCYGVFFLGSNFRLKWVDDYSPPKDPFNPQYDRDAHRRNTTHEISFLPFELAVEYVCKLNSEFFEYFKIYYNNINRIIEEDRPVIFF
jgi:hypothetical protein